MWVQFTQTYSGELGLFVKDDRRDLDEKIVKQLPKDCFRHSIAPWDEHKDVKAEKAAEKKRKAALAMAKVIAMKEEMKGLRKIVAKINELKKELADAEPRARALAKEARIPWPEVREAKAAANS